MVTQRKSYIDDEDEICKDGESIHVPVHLMDATQRAVATEGLRLHDGMGNPAGHKPGYVFVGNSEQRHLSRMLLKSCEGITCASPMTTPKRAASELTGTT
jgi:hypothetical protein